MVICLRDAHLGELLDELGLIDNACTVPGTVIVLAHRVVAGAAWHVLAEVIGGCEPIDCGRDHHLLLLLLRIRTLVGALMLMLLQDFLVREQLLLRCGVLLLHLLLLLLGGCDIHDHS